MSEETKNEVGRPSKINSEELLKLEYAYTRGCTNREAALYAGVGESTLYTYLSENPQFRERRDSLLESLTLKARFNVADTIIKGDEVNSKWYLERKKKGEFSVKTESENTNKNINLNMSEATKENIEEINKILDEII